jgi:hypothetical protein
MYEYCFPLDIDCSVPISIESTQPKPTRSRLFNLGPQSYFWGKMPSHGKITPSCVGRQSAISVPAALILP